MEITEEQFKGKPVLVFRKNAEDEYPFLSFGIAKAKAILENIEAIRVFVDKHDPK